MAIGSYAEVEQKFEVPEGADTPTKRPLTGLGRWRDGPEWDLDAVYYDTRELNLVSAGITLRRRTGGDDAGWHLKLPVAADERQELRVPLGADDEGRVPPALLDHLRVHIRDHPVIEVAHVRTHRGVHELVDDAGGVLAELCDDRVTADRVLPPVVTTQWREWEVELVEGAHSVLGPIADVLLEAGARPASAGSKLARALGGGAVGALPPRARLATDTVGQVMVAYLEEQLEQLKIQDPWVRVDAPDSVHKMRVAARRARSTLASYAPLLEPGTGDLLRTRLRWLGSVLGQARDAEVLRGRLDRILTEQPDTLALGRVAQEIEHELDARHSAGLSRAEGLLDSEEYVHLLDTFERFAQTPPFTGAAGLPARSEVSWLVHREWVRLMKRAKRAEQARAPAEHDAALHEVRKAAKRLRYAAESAVPVLGDRAATLAAHCEVIQDALGDHHDSVVTRQVLDKVHTRAGNATDSRSVFKNLHVREAHHAQTHEREYATALAELPQQHRRRWLLGS
jgi:CHAD domain-containing protein